MQPFDYLLAESAQVAIAHGAVRRALAAAGDEA
jgi:hypothetical protein